MIEQYQKRYKVDAVIDGCMYIIKINDIVYKSKGKIWKNKYR